MYVAIIHVHVKPEHLEAFITASRDNVENSVREPGIARFDFVQQQDDPTRFVLIEVYRSPDAQEAHRQSAHYQRWRDAVADMMAEPRTGTRYSILFPPEPQWEYPTR